MASSVLWVEGLPRALSMIPHVRTLEYLKDFQFVNGRCQSLQFCLRLSAGSLEHLEIRLNDRLYRVGFPHFMVKYPGDRIEFLNAEGGEVFYFSYQPETASSFLRSLPQDFRIREIPRPEGLPWVLAMLESCRCRLHEPGVADRLDLGCYMLLHEALLHLAVENTVLREDDKKILKIASWLQNHFTEKIDVAALARQYGFSLRSFLRHWARNFDSPPGSYVGQLKILEAKRLLLETRLPLPEIAARLGFADDGYFRRFFRRHTGLSPREYRKF